MSYTIGLQISNGLINSQSFIFNALQSYESESGFIPICASEHFGSFIRVGRLKSQDLLDISCSKNYFELKIGVELLLVRRLGYI